MRTGDKIATAAFWLVGLFIAGTAEFYAVDYLLKDFNLWLALAAFFGIVCIGLGVRQCWKTLRDPSI